MNTIFDFHSHPTFKSFLTATDQDQKDSPWDTFRGKALQLIEPIFRSQSNFSQMNRGHVSISVLPIVPLEEGFSELTLINEVAPRFLELSEDFLRLINAENFSYHELFWQEYDHLDRHLTDDGRRINILRSFDDIVEDDKVINLLIGMEGSHGLQDGARTNEVKDLDAYLHNFKHLKQESRFSLFYLTLTHLTWNNVCNHCFGTTISDDNIFKPNPQIKGVGPAGFKIIDMAYNVNEGRRVLIDIKHMSAYSRQEFYKYRDKAGYNDIPLVATHIGVTGFPLCELLTRIEPSTYYGGPNKEYTVVDYKEVPGIGEGNRNRTDFNPWSINLYDEDIEHIIASDGLMGLSLDQRILGFGANKEEYFMAQEFVELLKGDICRPDSERLETKNSREEFMRDFDEDDLNAEELRARRRRHIRYFTNNLLHIIRVGGPKAWKHVCIGSDFDGLINPINNCVNSIDLPDLENDLIPIVAEMIEEDLAVNPDHKYYVTDLSAQIRDLMYNNGHNFLKKYYSQKYLSTGKV